MKLWQKNTEADKKVETFTIGNDRNLDLQLAPFDVIGSMAHITMLEQIGLISTEELKLLRKELKNIYQDIEKGNFSIEEGTEDIHSQVENLLTQRIGEAGKKIHSGRSRNDQVLVDLKLFFRHKIKETVSQTENLFNLLINLSEEHKSKLLPGYTHLQVAMPSSLGLWFGAYAESLTDDLQMLLAAYKITNKNPLGSAAGYGSSFPLNRTLTTELLGFDEMNYNVVYAQMSRGKTEKCITTGIASIAATLSRMAMDICLYMNQNFGFVSFPDELTTGSSIMPHKKNPDVFELIRGRCNRLQSLPNEISLMMNNLPSGYHRDYQLTKDVIFPAFKQIEECLEMMQFMLKDIQVKENILDDEKYRFIWSVESVNQAVLSGQPFREAYKNIGTAIEAGIYEPVLEINHTHEGSIGNLCNHQIQRMMKQVIEDFNFQKAEKSIEKLICGE
jgi:argininosuccinate lyase